MPLFEEGEIKMMDTKELEQLEKVAEELQKYYRRNEKDIIITLPQIFARAERETFISLWLTYLLDPKKNGFGIRILQSIIDKFCEIHSLELIQFDEDDVILINVEHYLEPRYIDIYVETKRHIIGIENKINAGEGMSQTEDYYKTLKDKALDSKKDLICIFLKPQRNKANPSCQGFKVLTYTQVVEALKSIPHDYQADIRKSFFLNEFILYVEEILMKNETGYPVLEGAAKIYQTNKENITRAEAEYSIYKDSFRDWFLSELASEYDPSFVYEKAAFSDNYWQFCNKKWKEIKFHFELWNRNCGKPLFDLAASDKVYLCAHIEDKKYQSQFDGATKYSLHEELITVDFSDEKKSIESIKKIAAKLKEHEFDKWAKIANCLVV